MWVEYIWADKIFVFSGKFEAEMMYYVPDVCVTIT